MLDAQANTEQVIGTNGGTMKKDTVLSCFALGGTISTSLYLTVLDYLLSEDDTNQHLRSNIWYIEL